MPRTPQPSGTSHGPALGTVWDWLVAPGKSFPLVALGGRTMGQTHACCHVPKRHRWFHSRSKSVALLLTLVAGWLVDRLHRCSKATAA